VRPAGKLSKAKQAERQARILGAEQAVLNYIHTTPREDIVPATYLALMMAEWETRHENDEKKDDDDDDDDDDEDDGDVNKGAGTLRQRGCLDAFGRRQPRVDGA
jgi:hypothetical protein